MGTKHLELDCAKNRVGNGLTASNHPPTINSYLPHTRVSAKKKNKKCVFLLMLISGCTSVFPNKPWSRGHGWTPLPTPAPACISCRAKGPAFSLISSFGIELYHATLSHFGPVFSWEKQHRRGVNQRNRPHSIVARLYSSGHRGRRPTN